MRKKIFFFINIFLLSVIQLFSQPFDSVRVYAVYMNTSYYTTMDKELLKNEVEPLVFLDKKEINSIYRTILDTIKGSRIKRLSDNNLDIRIFFEFYNNGKACKIIGITNYNTLFIDKTLYIAKHEYLKNLDKYIRNFSKIIGTQ